MMLPMKPDAWRSRSGMPEIMLPMKPPTNEPAMPTSAVAMKPIDWRPGMIARARNPTMRPNRMNMRIDMVRTVEQGADHARS